MISNKSSTKPHRGTRPECKPHGAAAVMRVAPVRLRDRFAALRLGSPATKRSGDSNEIEPVILVGYWRGTPSVRGLAKITLAWKADTRSALGFGGGVGPQSWSEPRLTDVGPGLQRAQTAGGGDHGAPTVGADAPSWICRTAARRAARAWPELHGGTGAG